MKTLINRAWWFAALMCAAAPAAAQTPAAPTPPAPQPATPPAADAVAPDAAAPDAAAPEQPATDAPVAPPDAAEVTATAAPAPTDVDFAEEVVLTDKVFTATREARDPFDTPAAVNIVNRKDVDRRRMTTGTDLVRDLPGVWANGSGFINTTPNLRSTIGNQILVMIDGVRINTASIPSGPNSLFQTMDLENMERIEIVRGPGSVAWGTDALGGIVHVFTQTPPEWAAEGEATRHAARLSASYGTVDLLQRYRAEVGVAGSRVRGQIGVTSMQRGDLESAGDNGILSPSSWRTRALDGRIDVKPFRDQVLTFMLQDHRNDDIQQYEISLQRPQVTDSMRRLGLVKWTATAPLAGVRRVEVWAAFHQQRSLGLQINNGTEQLSKTLSLSLDAQGTSGLGSKADLTYGVHAHRDSLNSLNTNRLAAHTRAFPESTWLDLAAFANGEVRVHPRLALVAGARVDVYTLKSDPDAASVPNGLTIDELDVNDTSVAPTGSVGLVAHATPWLNVVGSVSRGFRAPAVSDQLSSGANRQSYSYPSVGLAPETDLNFEGGVKVRRDRVSGSVTGFYLKINDLIQTVRRNPDDPMDCVDIDRDMMCDPNEFITVKENVGKAHIAGAEFEATVEVVPHLTASVVGTWNTGRDDSGKQALTFNIPTNGTLTLRYAPERFYVEGWLRGVAAMDASELQCARVQSDAGYHVDPRDVNSPLIGTLMVTTVDGVTTCSGEYPGYTMAGLRAGATVTSSVDVNLSLNNLTNTAYRDKDARFDGPGFGFFATLNVRAP